MTLYCHKHWIIVCLKTLVISLTKCDSKWCSVLFLLFLFVYSTSPIVDNWVTSTSLIISIPYFLPSYKHTPLDKHEKSLHRSKNGWYSCIPPAPIHTFSTPVYRFYVLIFVYRPRLWIPLQNVWMGIQCGGIPQRY